MNYKSSAELKALAREQLKGKYGVPMGAFVITMLISFAASLITSLFVNESSTTSLIINYLISFIISLLTAVLSMGLIKFFINFCRNEKYQISDIFWGFRNHPDKAIVATLLLTLIYVAILIPGTALFVAYAIMDNVFVFVVALIATIVGLVVMIVLSLMYSLIYYILADVEGISAIEALRTSRSMMKGNKGRLFYLGISFIGWYLLAILSCGIALLWIEPYAMCATTYFYMDLKGEFRQTTIDELV
jgi:uncharacterized membrane protein